MRHSLIGLLLLLVSSLPSGKIMGIKIRTCSSLQGRCYFGCPLGWTWVSFCHNIMSCCIKMKNNLPPQAIKP
uniref:Defensin beta 136 n=1 Tax=Suricata suricatta TaxID=37032 RepID=A0A673UH54_SURSU